MLFSLFGRETWKSPNALTKLANNSFLKTLHFVDDEQEMVDELVKMGLNVICSDFNKVSCKKLFISSLDSKEKFIKCSDVTIVKMKDSTVDEILKSYKSVFEKKYKWNDALLKYLDDTTEAIYNHELFVQIEDAYPKSKLHFLLLSKLPVNDISELDHKNEKHLDLLNAMENRVQEIKSMHPRINFLVGFHSKPSMNRLHLHVLSNDLCGAALKTKAHYNSFTTEFFKPLSMVKTCISKGDKLQQSEYGLDSELKCHFCHQSMRNAWIKATFAAGTLMILLSLLSFVSCYVSVSNVACKEYMYIEWSPVLGEVAIVDLVDESNFTYNVIDFEHHGIGSIATYPWNYIKSGNFVAVVSSLSKDETLIDSEKSQKFFVPQCNTEIIDDE